MFSENCPLVAETTLIRPPRKRRHVRTVFLFLIVVGWILGPGLIAARGQAVDYLQNIGIPPFSALSPVENGYINPASADLHLEIPMGTFPQRGGGSVKLAFAYDSGLWSQSGGGWTPWGNTPYTGYSGVDVFNGWYVVVSSDPGTVNYNFQDHYTCTKDGLPYWDTYNGWTYSAPDGTTHAFSISTTQGYVTQCGDFTSHNVPTGDAVAMDGSGYHMYVTNFTSANVYAPDGTLVYTGCINGNEYPKDANGNYMNTVSGACISGRSTTDTLKRTLLSMTANGNTLTYNVLNEAGGTSPFIVTKETINVHSNFGSSGSTAIDWSGTITVIQSIQLPDGTSYSFTYDSGTSPGNYGQLQSMTLPTHGQINYSYANFADSMYSPWKHITRGISTRTTPNGMWNYAPLVLTQCTVSSQANCQQQLTVTKPSTDNTVYKYNLNGGPWPIEIDYYTGGVSTANLQATHVQSMDYSHVCTNRLDACAQTQAIYVTKLSETTTLPTSSTTSVHQTTQSCYDINYGNLLYKWDWNFYTGSIVHDPNPPSTCSLYSGSTPDRTTALTYLNGSSYLAKNIYNRLQNTLITDKNGATVAQTINSYDGAALVTTGATGIAQHDDANYGSTNNVRGNLTQVQDLISGTSNYLTKSMTYDITGQLRTETDWANNTNNPTLYTYTDNFYTDAGDTFNENSYTPALPTNAYLTNITFPTVNSVAMTNAFGYYWGTGQKALSTDSNTQTSYFHFYDLLNRPTSEKFPDTGWNYSVYPNASETQVDTAVGITSPTLSINCGTSGSCRHDQYLTDSVGRPSSHILVSDPGGQTTVTTLYDSTGRVNSITNPHRSGSSPTDGTELYAYDGLDRKINVTRPDGNIAYTYYGATVGLNGGRGSQLCPVVGYPVLYKDEATKLRQTWTDGFGRLIEVDEPDPSTGSLTSGAYAGTCYAYDLNNNLIGVVQPTGEATCTLNGATYNRCFAYDMLSRLTAATNPESGTINYYYTTSGGALCAGEMSAVCRRTDARTITTTYTYDALNRLTSKTYSDSTTPGAYYDYDQTTALGLTLANPIGRLTTEGTYSNGAWLTLSAFSYDQLGRVNVEVPCLGTNCVAADFAYDLAGDMDAIVYPSTREVITPYNGAMQPTQVTFAKYNGTNVGYNYASSMSYAPTGTPTGLTLGSGVIETDC